uniref:Cysteine protease n=1 Tax=Kalanchoe fedtschenkoi TaxID=63787 RepID=A0A7N1A9U8_KALFE
MAKIHHHSLLPSILLALLALLSFGTLALSRTVPVEDLEMMKMYEEWMVKHGRVHDNIEEKERRFKIFKENVERVNAHNSVKGRKFDLAVNKFADLTNEEFRAKYTGRLLTRPPTKQARGGNLKLTDDVPTSIDWRKKGAVGKVGQQGGCGSCWAFSAVAAMEGIVQIKTGELLDLSEQELVDCDTFDDGCDGGLMDNAFKWIIQNGGLNSEEAYPYKGEKGECNTTLSSVSVASITGYVDVPEDDEKALQQAVAQQPVSIGINSNSFEFQLYGSGVYNGSCNADLLTHGVVIVGYDVTEEEGKPYWILKNSWGLDWGEDGYMRIDKDVKDKRGKCGLAMLASYPTIE